MALNEKQKRIILKGLNLRKARKEGGKDILDIIESTITGQALTNFLIAIKTEFIARCEDHKKNIDARITDINS